jgi:DHA1 family arabinose polymer transporter-like MFS transporter
MMKKTLVPLALGGLSIGTTEFVMMGLLQDVASDFSITIPQAGHLISAYALGVVIGAPLLVAASGRFPPKNILLFLMGMFVVFNGLSALAPDANWMFGARLLSGLPHGAFFGVGAVVASRLADKGKEAQAISMMFTGLTIANVAAVPIGTYVGHHYSWRWTFCIIAGIGLITMLFIRWWLPAMPSTRNTSLMKELGLFRRPEVWLVIAITSIGTGGLFAWISYISPIMTEVAHFSENMVPYIMILAGVGMVVGNLLGGKLADAISPATACIVSLLAIAACLVIDYFVAYNQVLALIMTFITGVITFSLGTPIQMLMIRTAKEAEMLGASVTQASFNAGNALGAFWGGLPIAAGLGYTSSLLVGVIMALTGVLLLWWFMAYTKMMRPGYTTPN